MGANGAHPIPTQAFHALVAGIADGEQFFLPDDHRMAIAHALEVMALRGHGYAAFGLAQCTQGIASLVQLGHLVPLPRIAALA